MSKTKDQTPSQQNIPSPKELMRFLHPELFSDTLIDYAYQLPKEMFEYLLDTLTSRKQEYEFENFCRKLAEKEICPNLRTQTGPTGGGDSKVDSETYPVAQKITERWWVGSPSAGTELWGFAFSAKKRWKQKVKADVDKILSTGRDYKRIYFFTNQFVKDKDRANQEETLSDHAGIPVHIIDRAWIVEKVYESDHLELAVSALGIESGQKESVKHVGPRDVARLAELENLDKQTADPSNYQGARYQLVEDCLRSAILARGLERNRNEVESRFAQTDRLAQDLNYKPQRLRIAYNRAWTAWWWYEDYRSFDKFYQEVEQFVKGSTQACEVQLLLNLWQLLIGSVLRGQISAKDGKVKDRQKRLIAMLKNIAADPKRPNNALQAHTSLILIKITEALKAKNPEQLESCWPELKEVVEKSKSLGGYSVEQLFETVVGLGEHVDSPAFDSLYEELVTVMRQRHSDRDAGCAYIKRGEQKFLQKKYYDAIRWFGRAEGLLMKNESRTELITTLIRSSDAYECVGLLWAARNKALAAVEQAWTIFNKQGDITFQLLMALNQLVCIELQLGRIPHVLDAMLFASNVASNLQLSEKQQNIYDQQTQMQDLVLGIHMLNLPFKTLSGSVARLPDTLERLGLICGWATLLFVLGHEKILHDEGNIFVSGDPDADQEFFEKWQNQPAADDIPPQPILIEGETSLLKSTILGSELVMETPNNAVSFGLTESLLGVLEAFLATSYEHAMPHCERMTITVRASQQMTGLPQLHFADDDGGRAEIVHPAELMFTTAAERQDYMKWLRNSLIEIMCRMLMIQNTEVWLEEVAGQEYGFSRALALGDAFMLNTNIFGEKPKVRLDDWLETNNQTYSLLRKKPWSIAKTVSKEKMTEPEFYTGPRPLDLIDKAQLKHTDYKVISPIDELLWDQAKWQGMLFELYPQKAPMLALIFEDGKAGQAIFRAWKEQWGDEDQDEALRLAIVVGLSKQNPAMYAVSVGPSFRYLNKHKGKTLTLVSQINRMTPASSKSLDSFLMAYKKAGVFSLAPAQMNEDEEPAPFPKLAIIKKQLFIREAWEIGENDPDIGVLQKDDDPITPNR